MYYIVRRTGGGGASLWSFCRRRVVCRYSARTLKHLGTQLLFAAELGDAGHGGMSVKYNTLHTYTPRHRRGGGAWGSGRRPNAQRPLSGGFSLPSRVTLYSALGAGRLTAHGCAPLWVWRAVGKLEPCVGAVGGTVEGGQRRGELEAVSQYPYCLPGIPRPAMTCRSERAYSISEGPKPSRPCLRKAIDLLPDPSIRSQCVCPWEPITPQPAFGHL